MVFGPATVMVALRLITRKWITHNFGWDDVTILLAQIVNSCGMGFVMAEVFYGLGRHLHYLSPYQYNHYLRYDYLDWIQVFVTLAISKISICLFLMRLSKFDRLRKFLQVLIAFLILTHVPLTLLMIFQCRPVQKYWNQEMKGDCFPKTTVEKIIITQGVISIVTDFIGAAFPIFLLWNVDIKLRSKVALCLLMGLGVVTAAACIVRTALSWEIKSNDLTWVGVGNALARIFEINLGMIAACIPLMKPLIRFIRTYLFGPPSSSRLSSDENLSKGSRWYTRLWRHRGFQNSSHGVNEPEDFEDYVKYTRDQHRRRRLPGTGAAVRAEREMMENVARVRNEPVLSSVPSVASLHLPLHGVPTREEGERGERTLRYSTADPIQELKGILETGRLSRNLEEEIRRSESMDESMRRLSRYSTQRRPIEGAISRAPPGPQPPARTSSRHIVQEMRRSRSSGKWDEEMGRRPRRSERHMDDELKHASKEWEETMRRSRRSSRHLTPAETRRASRRASARRGGDEHESGDGEDDDGRTRRKKRLDDEEMAAAAAHRRPMSWLADADPARRRSWRYNTNDEIGEDEIGRAR